MPNRARTGTRRTRNFLLAVCVADQVLELGSRFIDAGAVDRRKTDQPDRGIGLLFGVEQAAVTRAARQLVRLGQQNDDRATELDRPLEDMERMPPDVAELASSKIELVRDWIEAGAAND